MSFDARIPNSKEHLDDFIPESAIKREEENDVDPIGKLGMRDISKIYLSLVPLYHLA